MKSVLRKLLLLLWGALIFLSPSCRKEYVNEIGPKVYIDDVIFSLQGGTQTVKIHGREKSLDLFITTIKSMDDNHYYENDYDESTDKDLKKGIVSSHEVEGLRVVIRPNSSIEVTVTSTEKARAWQVFCMELIDVSVAFSVIQM